MYGSAIKGRLVEGEVLQSIMQCPFFLGGISADDCWVSCESCERRLKEDHAALLSMQDEVTANDCWVSCDPWERRLKV